MLCFRAADMCKNILQGVIRKLIVPALQHAPVITFNSKTWKLITVFANSVSLFICWIFSNRIIHWNWSVQEVHLKQAFLTGKNTLIIIF